MKIRTRLLILLLLITLVPLILSTIFHSYSALRLSHDLTSDTREQLQKNAFTLLHTLVDEYGQILKRDETQILLALQLQAREVERLLASPSKTNLPIYFSEDFDHHASRPEGLTPSTKHFRPDQDGDLQAIPVTYQQQVVFLTKGIERQAVADDLGKLATMPETYRLVHDIRPDLFLWQYTALDKGIHTSFPGKGGYPSEYDPRQREWYLAARSADAPISRVITDLSTHTLILTMAMPVHSPDGSFAGVTAIDVIYRWLFSDWTIPDSWRDVSESMILFFHAEEPEPKEKLEIVYREEQHALFGNWKMPVQRQFLQADEPEQLSPIFEDLQNGRSGVRKVRYLGENYLWAYGRREPGRPFPLISLPYQQVVAQASKAEAYAQEQVLTTLKFSALMLLIVAAVVSVLAVFRSRAVTRPVLELADAAKDLSEGNFGVRVDINTRDELEYLGKAFNNMGVSLLERNQMKQSLALAREVQQHLLPSTSPQLAGFDIHGKSLYCDETGGDYYDFIEIDTGHMGLAIGDVSGHGIGAALLMATARGILRSQVSQDGSDDLVALLKTLNQHLVRDTRDDYFVTFFYSLLDSQARTCHWISAGHGPTFYYSRSKQTTISLPCSGIPLGIFEETDFDVNPPLSMASGDILLIGTDGVWETRSPEGELFGTERLCSLLEKYSMTTSTEICTAIMEEVTDFRKTSPQLDDITMVVIKSV
ncbi:MAG: SpoIIE family protein phosphatase [Desulfuromusa sp.]|nr:SpoIIE family protein phosphatase [Desulfuromusa sp.]